MRILIALLLAAFFSASTVAQKRFLVSPNQEVIPIPPGSSAQSVIAKQSKEPAVSKALTGCSTEAQFGYDPVRFPIDARFGFSHRDVLGEWFVAPARGTVDTFFFETNGDIGLPDSSVFVRIFKSNISPGHGPGYDYPAPCRSWGYWTSTADQENGIAGFLEDATDTTWHSTIGYNGGTVPSFEPFGLSVWGMGGVPLKLKPNTVNAIPMDIIPGGFQIKPHSPSVRDTIDIGEAFFFSLKLPSAPGASPYPDLVPTQFAASSTGSFPARDWKFYEHDSGPSPTCAGTPSSMIKKGWVARGPLVDDTTAGTVFNVWYVMTPVTNIPPKINLMDRLEYTLSAGARTITIGAFDCDAENPGHAGVESVYARIRVTDLAGTEIASGTVTFTYAGGDSYTGTFPDVGAARIVSYKVFAYDSTGLADSTAEFRYRTVDLNSMNYRADTTLPCSTASIAGTGNAIGASDWLLPPGASNTHPGNDGTAGPFSLGGPFVYFGDTVNYAWVGVNGAIALSRTATDTLDVNSNGFFTDAWDLPQRQYHGRADSAGQSAGLMPRNLIAPFSANWIVRQDNPMSTFGHIRYSSTAFPNKFVTEWDSVAAYNALGAIADNDVFRVVLDRSSGSIQFQYDNIGQGGLEMHNLTGMQSDSLTHPGPVTPFNFWNKDGFPAETRLHNGLCVTYSPCAYLLSLTDGWNLVSIGVIPPSNSTRFLFQTSLGNAFRYDGGYNPTPTVTLGRGYWIKVGTAQTICVAGTPVPCVDDTVVAGWNIIGSGWKPVAVSSITSSPPGIVASPCFGFNNSYNVASVVVPGHAYWLRVTSPGVLHICAGSGMVPKEAPGVTPLARLARVTIQDKLGRAQTLYIGSDETLTSEGARKYEMPPGVPEGGFDARFASGRMVEVYPSNPDPDNHVDYPILLQGGIYPLAVRWEGGSGSTHKLALMAVIGKETKTLDILGAGGAARGQVTISDPAVDKLVLRMTDGPALPKKFALSQNYPNPFNPTTHFTVDVPRLSVVDITVYDVLGRKIVTLMGGEQGAGYHPIEWDSKDSHGLTVPSGMYVVRMTAEEFTAVRKVLLMR